MLKQKFYEKNPAVGQLVDHPNPSHYDLSKGVFISKNKLTFNHVSQCSDLIDCNPGSQGHVPINQL